MQELEVEGGRGYTSTTVAKMHVQKMVRFREAHSLHNPTTYTGMIYNSLLLKIGRGDKTIHPPEVRLACRDSQSKLLSTKNMP